MAKKKAISGLKNGRDSKSKKLGFKYFSNELIKPGQIIIRQRGSKFIAGKNTSFGKDFTIFSKIHGKIKIFKKKKKLYIYVINDK